jgi:putative Mg2+ transporter-C (MgtC) family protein
MTISDGEVLLRLAIAVALCGAIGLERESRDQVAGLRTHILVGVGAALFTLVSAYGFSEFGTARDPTRIAAQIVSGIGFLGAGAILRQGFNVRGLTTAATLWVVAAIGMACGAGYYFGAAVTAAAVLVALILFRRLRPVLMSRLRTDFVLVDLGLVPDGPIGKVFGELGRRGATVTGMDTEIEEVVERIRLQVRVPPEVDVEEALSAIAQLDGVRSVSAAGVGLGRVLVTSEDD